MIEENLILRKISRLLDSGLLCILTYLNLLFCVGINEMCFLPLNNLFLPMITDFHSNKLLTNSSILKGIQNLTLKSNQSQTSYKKIERQQKDHPIKNKLKNKTMPPSMVPKITKAAEFEKLIHSKVSDLIVKQFIIDLYRGVKYLTKSLIGPHQSAIQAKQVQLEEPVRSKEKFLFLDLDQTLIFTERQKTSNSKSNQISFKIRIRPYTQQFLSNISKHYNIYIFTAATKEYAEAVIKKLDPGKKFIQDYLCRDDCFETKRGKIIKDLRIVKNRTLKDMVLLDNKPQSFGLQIDNGIPILDFYGDKNDVELQHLEKVLVEISQLDDVRKGITTKFRLRELAQLTKEELQEYLKKSASLGSSEKNLNESMKS